MSIKNAINKIYIENKALTSRDFVNSRRYFIYEACTAIGITSLTSGAFLAGFASYMGAADNFNGIIGAIPAAAGVIQMFSSIIFEKLEKRKFLISLGSILYRILLSSIFLIPFLIHGTVGRLAALGIIYSVAYLISSFINPPTLNWMVDLTPEPLRGTYFARKDAVSLGFLTVLTIIMGMIMDLFEKYNNQAGGFLVIGFFALAMTLLDTFFLSKIEEPSEHRSVVIIKFRDVIKKPLKNARYRKVIILFLLWNIGLQIGGPFFSIYMVTGLKLDYTYIMILGVLTSFVRVFAAKYWGRLANRKSWFFTTQLSITLLAIGHISWFFIDHRTAYFIFPLINILGGIAWSGVNLSLFNIQFVMAPEEGRTMYLGASSTLGGVAGFISTLIGSVIVSLFKDVTVDFAGFHFVNMHIVFALSGIILFITALYVHLCISRRETK